MIIVATEPWWPLRSYTRTAQWPPEKAERSRTPCAWPAWPIRGSRVVNIHAPCFLGTSLELVASLRRASSLRLRDCPGELRGGSNEPATFRRALTAHPLGRIESSRGARG